MSTCVCVLSNNGERLMPTIRLGRVRHLLKDGKAKIIKHHPFTIQLLYDSKTNTQPIEICEDVGYNYIGISVKSQSHEYVSAQYDTLQDEKACHDSCRKLRRTRRNRLRYRKPRFDNRKRGESWLAPSLKHKKELNVNVVKMYCTVMPITHATVEVGSFDTMLRSISYRKQQGFVSRVYMQRSYNGECASLPSWRCGFDSHSLLHAARQDSFAH